jgi:O-antigen/teichoic acid export membrane protein
MSLTLLAISSVIDRFMIANLVGTGDAGKYVSGLDLVRQTLMMPATSLAAAFFPLAVHIYAKHGAAAVRAHLGDCVELLVAVMLPACLGFAVISPHVANIVLGSDFRDIASAVMPIVAIAVIFQVLTQQYLHASFLLARRNSFYLVNTATIIFANLILAYALVRWNGAVGAAWARLGADIVGFVCALFLTRRAFAVPLPVGRLALATLAALTMALLVAMVDRTLRASDPIACAILISVGFISYAALCWVFDIARIRQRLKQGVALVRSRLAHGRARQA